MQMKFGKTIITNEMTTLDFGKLDSLDQIIVINNNSDNVHNVNYDEISILMLENKKYNSSIFEFNKINTKIKFEAGMKTDIRNNGHITTSSHGILKNLSSEYSVNKSKDIFLYIDEYNYSRKIASYNESYNNTIEKNIEDNANTKNVYNKFFDNNYKHQIIRFNGQNHYYTQSIAIPINKDNSTVIIFTIQYIQRGHKRGYDYGLYITHHVNLISNNNKNYYTLSNLSVDFDIFYDDIKRMYGVDDKLKPIFDEFDMFLHFSTMDIGELILNKKYLNKFINEFEQNSKLDCELINRFFIPTYVNEKGIEFYDKYYNNNDTVIAYDKSKNIIIDGSDIISSESVISKNDVEIAKSLSKFIFKRSYGVMGIIINPKTGDIYNKKNIKINDNDNLCNIRYEDESGIIANIHNSPYYIDNNVYIKKIKGYYVIISSPSEENEKFINELINRENILKNLIADNNIAQNR